MSETEVIEERKKNFFNKFKNTPIIAPIILAIIVIVAYVIRVANLPLLKDATTGKYIPVELDSFLFLRYAEYILEHGKLMALDTMRYFPLGYNTAAETTGVSYFVVWLYKFLHIFSSTVTIQYVDAVFPPIVTAISLIVFYLLVREFFNYRVALVATAFLAFIPTYLYRTMAGFADKEALAMLFFFLALYLYARSWRATTQKQIYAYSLFSGISTALVLLTWGGVDFIFLSVGAFLLVELLLQKMTTKRFYAYIIWLVPILLSAFFLTKRYTPDVFFSSITSGILIVTLLALFVHYLLEKPHFSFITTRTRKYIPDGATSIVLSFGISLLGASLIFGFTFMYNLVVQLLVSLTNQFGQNRWAITVAENHQPYVVEWLGQLGSRFVWLFIIGSVVYFYEMLTNIHLTKNQKYLLTGGYAIFILGFIFSRYSPSSSILNGTSPIALFLYLGLFAIFTLTLLVLHIHSYQKNQERFNSTNKIPSSYVMLFIIFLIMMVAGRTASRLLFLFSPFISIFAAYLIDKIYQWGLTLKDAYKYIIIALILIVLFLPFSAPGTLGKVIPEGIISNYYHVSAATVKASGPGYHNQWQRGMAWVRENTPPDAVFAHWWDYGYWVQYGGQRATLTDGGNARGGINYFMGRHVLTGHSDQEALELLAANNATHLLMVADEIGKYPAFSSIGSDVNYDRYAYITTFVLNDQLTQEGRDGAIIVTYTGGSSLDHPITYEGKTYTGENSGISGFQLPVKQPAEGATDLSIGQPTMIMISNGQQVNLPMKCVWYNKKKYSFDTGIDACIQLIPYFTNPQNANGIGGLLYVSPEVSKTQFAKLYLFDQDNENFTKVYDDSDYTPLALYQGQLIGPMKIWAIHYPDHLVIPPEYYKSEIPDERVNTIGVEN